MTRGGRVITDELILRSLKRETSGAEERELRAWRGRSTGNEERYRLIQKLWRLRPLLELAPSRDEVPTSDEILSAKMKWVDGSEREATPTGARLNLASWSREGRRALSRLRRAATLVPLLLGAGMLGYLIHRGGEHDVAGSVELITAAQEVSSFRLADGSVVRLAPESRLHVEITRATRRARLHGRAFFAVNRDAGRPFLVQTHAGNVVVEGTRFDLQARAGNLELIVVDGAVGLAAGGDTIQVRAGQRSHVREGHPPELEKVDDVYGSLGWAGNFVAFESTPLREVARELERRYGLQIHIPDSVLAAQTVTSWSTDRSPQEILAAVCIALNAYCTTRDSVTTIEY